MGQNSYFQSKGVCVWVCVCVGVHECVCMNVCVKEKELFESIGNPPTDQV